MRLIDVELSEPYSVFTYRYFLHSWAELCWLAHDVQSSRCVGTVVAKLETHRGKLLRGYIAMLTVERPYRAYGIGAWHTEGGWGRDRARGEVTKMSDPIGWGASTKSGYGGRA